MELTGHIYREFLKECQGIYLRESIKRLKLLIRAPNLLAATLLW